MKNKVFTKITAMALALVMAVSPVTADAAEKKVVTNADYKAYLESIEDEDENHDWTLVYDYVKSLNGCYNEKDHKDW